MSLALAEPAVRVICVDPAYVEKLMEPLWPMIDSAYEAVDEPVPVDLFENLRSGRYLMWVAVTDGIVTAILISVLVKLRSGPACRLLACAGELQDCNAMIGPILEYARVEKCHKVQLEGRVGWAKVLRGFKVVRTVIELEF